MATFLSNFGGLYDANTTLPQQTGTAASGAFTINDGEGDSVFSIDDTNISITNVAEPHTYLGRYVDTVELMPGTNVFTPVDILVFVNNVTGVHTVYANLPTPFDTSHVYGQIDSPITLSGLNTADYTVCFAAGTLIATPTGEKAVEDLAIGDMVQTHDGNAVPVKWIGRQTMLKVFASERACPVRIKTGALGGNLPHTDLVLTADHALSIDGLAVNAGTLVNGTNITREAMADLPDASPIII